MNHRCLKLVSAVALTVGLSTTANAILIDPALIDSDLGDGMIYDSEQNITWLQDANYAKTQYIESNGLKGDADGKMNWNAAKTWADNLVFGGYDDWRLPTMVDSDGPDADSLGNDGCNSQPYYDGTDCGYNVDTSGSELAYMWYDILGNTPYFDTNDSTTGCGGYPDYCLTSTSADGVNILNLQSYVYWSGTEYVPRTGGAWHFNTVSGGQGAGYKAP